MNPKPSPKKPPADKTPGPLIERPPGELRPWPTNPRTHSDKQLEKLKASIRQFGFTAPVLIDESGVILSGHGRTVAALELGLATIPTRTLPGLSAAQKRAYVIADNKIAQLAGWDGDLLKAEFELLIQSDFEIETTGFSTAEIDLLLDPIPPNGAEDPADLRPEDLVEQAVSRPGDLWTVGQHALYCGSALDATSYQIVLAGEPAQLVITDPPYNVPINGHVCGSGKVKHREFAMASGEMNSAEFTAFLSTALGHMHAASVDGAIAYVFLDWRHGAEILAAALPVFGAPRQLCVWVKDNAGMGTFYRSQHELVHVFKKGQAPHINNFELGQHGRYRTNVWTYPGVNSFKGKAFELLKLHPTVKPVGLIADAIRDTSHRGGLVLDPFAGSGTVLLAAERTGRRARAIELDPLYVDVAINRWQRVTGRQAVMAATGQTWDRVRADLMQTCALGTAP